MQNILILEVVKLMFSLHIKVNLMFVAMTRQKRVVNQKFPSLKGGSRVQMPNVCPACPLESTGATHLKRSQMTVM